MDIVKVKENLIVYSHKGGLKSSCCSDLIAIECDKPFIRLIFENEKVLIHASLSTIGTMLQNYFVRISRQVIVNILHSPELLFDNGSYWIYLKNGTKYKVSERREKATRTAFIKNKT